MEVLRPLSGRAPRVVPSLCFRVACTVLLGLAAAETSAQTRLSGRALDPDDRAVATARVTVIAPTGAVRTATTNERGEFAFEALPPGRYEVLASAPGLSAPLQTVDVGTAVISLDVRLRVAAVSEMLVVSASMTETPRSRAPGSVQVLDREELETLQVRTLGDALRLVPGFSVVQNGGPGTVTSVFPRGGESDYTLVLVDGVRANAFGGGMDLSQVPVEDVERIEVVSGPQSALFGSDAIGGVVQVVTRRDGPTMTRARIEGGSRDTRRVSGSTVGDTAGWLWQAGGELFQDDGFTGRAPGTGETVSNDDAQEGQGSAALGWRGAAGTELRGLVRYVETDRGAPGAYGSDPADRYAGIDRISRGRTWRRNAGLSLLQPWPGLEDRIRQRVDVDWANYALGFTSAFGRSDSSSRRLHARAQTDAALGAGFGVSGGVEWLGEEGTSNFITAAGSQVPIERGVLGTFGEVRWSPSARLSLTGGVRGERIRRDAIVGDPSASSPRPALPGQTVVSLNPKVAAAWTIGDDGSARTFGWTRLHAAAGTGIRPPDVFETFFTDNGALEPERSRSVEAGVTQAIAQGALQVSATGFHNRYDNLIVAVGRLTAASRYRTDNIANARSQGVELSAAWRPVAAISLRAAYTFLDTEILGVDGFSDQAPAPYRVGESLLRRPRHDASFDAAWTGQRAGVFAQWRGRGSRLDAEPAFGPSGGLYENEDYRVLAAGGSVRLLRGVEAFARVTNLFDTEYEEAFGFPSPGRLGFVGIRVAAGR